MHNKCSVEWTHTSNHCSVSLLPTFSPSSVSKVLVSSKGFRIDLRKCLRDDPWAGAFTPHSHCRGSWQRSEGRWRGSNMISPISLCRFGLLHPFSIIICPLDSSGDPLWTTSIRLDRNFPMFSLAIWCSHWPRFAGHRKTQHAFSDANYSLAAYQVRNDGVL